MAYFTILDFLRTTSYCFLSLITVAIPLTVITGNVRAEGNMLAEMEDKAYAGVVSYEFVGTACLIIGFFVSEMVRIFIRTFIHGDDAAISKAFDTPTWVTRAIVPAVVVATLSIAAGSVLMVMSLLGIAQIRTGFLQDYNIRPMSNGVIVMLSIFDIVGILLCMVMLMCSVCRWCWPRSTPDGVAQV